MGTDRHAEQEAPRDFKHLAIHVLVGMSFVVFSNIAAKDTVDLVVGIKNGELRIAGIRIKTSSFQSRTRKGRKESWGWYFSEDRVQYAIMNTPLFYIFCSEAKKTTEEALISEPIFVVISSADLKKKAGTFKNGNYAIEISENQVRGKGNWTHACIRTFFLQATACMQVQQQTQPQPRDTINDKPLQEFRANTPQVQGA